MIQADSVIYKFRRYLDQGSTGECSVYAFLGVLAELIENQTGIKTDFNYSEEFKNLKIEKAKDRMRTLSSHLWVVGFTTTDGRLVKGDTVRLGKASTREKFDKQLTYHIQAYGAGVMSVHYDKDTSLKSRKNGILTKVYEFVKGGGDDKAHAIGLVGYNNPLQYYILANSWGEGDSDVSIKYEDLYKIFNSVQFFDKISVDNILI